MVVLTITPGIKSAVDSLFQDESDNQAIQNLRRKLLSPSASEIVIGDSIRHGDLTNVSRLLLGRVQEGRLDINTSLQWRLDTLLKGTSVYKLPPLQKPEPVSLESPCPEIHPI